MIMSYFYKLGYQHYQLTSWVVIDVILISNEHYEIMPNFKDFIEPFNLEIMITKKWWSNLEKSDKELQ